VDGCAKLSPEFFPFAFAALNFAHRSFVAVEIFALAAADTSPVSSHQSFYHCYCQRFTAAIHTS
jgi:hypothetical protein